MFDLTSLTNFSAYPGRIDRIRAEDDEDLSRLFDGLGDFRSQRVTAAQVAGVHPDRKALPFEGKHDLDILTAHVRTKPKRFDAKGVPPRVIDLVMKCLEKKKDDRPKDGAALVAALSG